MNIKVLDSWLREFIKTEATKEQIAEKLSLSSVSVERIEPFNRDFVYDIEVTTNRPDLMGVIGIAREASAVLKQSGISAIFQPPKLKALENVHTFEKVIITNDNRLVNRVCAAIMEVDAKKTPQ